MNVYWDYIQPLVDTDSVLTKKGFGGLFIYYHGKLVLVLVDDTKKEYRGKKYKFAPFDGILIPTEKEFQPSLIKDFPFLKVNPVLQKWLMISPSESIGEDSDLIINSILKNDPRIGVIPKPRPIRKKKKISF